MCLCLREAHFHGEISALVLVSLVKTRLYRQLKNSGDSNVIGIHDICDVNAMLYQLSCEATQLEAGQFVGLICSREKGLDERNVYIWSAGYSQKREMILVPFALKQVLDIWFVLCFFGAINSFLVSFFPLLNKENYYVLSVEIQELASGLSRFIM